MNDPQPLSPRRRLQMLQAIPDNQKTEAEWEELNELEITLAPGNRVDGREYEPRSPGGGAPRAQGAKPRPQQGQGGGGGGGTGAGNPKPAAGAPQARKPFRKFKKKSPAPPEAGGS